MSALANSTLPPRGTSAGQAARPWPFSSQRLVEGLAAGRYVPTHELSAAVADATAGGRSVVEVLLERGLIGDVALRDAMSEIYGLAVVDPANVEPDDDVEGFSADLARRALVMPLGREENRIVVAVADPTRAAELREVWRAVGMSLDLRLAAYSQLALAVQNTFAPRVVVKLPTGEKTTLLLPPGDLKIGRASHNEIVINDPGISATHAVLRSHGDRYEVVDFGSRNGVFVNGERVRGSQRLRHKDEITIGWTRIKFTWPYLNGRSPQELEHANQARMHRTWIKFAGRVIAQMLGAAALVFLGLAIGGGLPSSCSTPNADAETPPAAVAR
jgi:pSer/pThr/pTyr-binding forkhead associated (FHA) protein